MRWPWQKKTEDATVSQPKEFVFETWEDPSVGDWHKYSVKADSRKEAFKKLIIYFFGDMNSVDNDIKSDSGQVTYPNRREIHCEGMPLWFAEKISGRETIETRKKLEKYCIENDIKLKS